MLDNHGEADKSEKVEEQEGNLVKEKKEIKEFAEEIIHDMVKKASSDDESQEEKFKCPKCEGMFMMKNKLEEHMNRVHTEVKVNLDLDKTQSKDCMNEH